MTKLERITFIVALHSPIPSSDPSHLNVEVKALSAGEAMKLAEHRNPGYNAVEARLKG
jgi:hypothetical protein